MPSSQRLTLLALLALTAAAGVGLFFTSGAPGIKRPSAGSPSSGASAGEPVVDQQPLETARQLALAANPTEQPLAADAERLADHEVDLAFTSALRTAGTLPQAATAGTRAIEERIQTAQAEVAQGQGKIKQLTAEAAKAGGGDLQAGLQQQIDLIQAEVSLHQDELADAQQDLTRAGGDPRGQIQQLLAEHEAAEHASGSVRLTAGSASALSLPAGSFIAEVTFWSALRGRRQQIVQAREDAASRAAALVQRHNALEKQVNQQKAGRQRAKQTSASATAEPGEAIQQGHAASPESAAAALLSVRQLSQAEEDLADLDKRIQDLQQLAATYGAWSALIETQERAALHNIVRSAFWIVLALLLAFLVRLLIDRSLGRLKLERKQQSTLRALLRFAVSTLAVLAILLVIFGVPSQLSTVLGLVGAGLTVALKDFIVSFLGWFVLMGRNGIHLGDWVEINGVRGEVVEIGLLRTVLLETGNWTEQGRLTGRQVAFLNIYAIEGYYFNFTTSGQWLWDDLQVIIPSGVSPYPLLEKIRAIVEKETSADTQEAEQEWKRVTRRYGVESLSVAPVVNMKPSSDGVQVIVRYMTRAANRSEVHSRLNRAVVELLHGEDGAEPVANAVPGSLSAPDRASSPAPSDRLTS